MSGHGFMSSQKISVNYAYMREQQDGMVYLAGILYASLAAATFLGVLRRGYAPADRNGGDRWSSECVSKKG